MLLSATAVLCKQSSHFLTSFDHATGLQQMETSEDNPSKTLRSCMACPTNIYSSHDEREQVLTNCDTRRQTAIFVAALRTSDCHTFRDTIDLFSLMSSPSMCVQLFTAFEEAILKLYGPW